MSRIAAFLFCVCCLFGPIAAHAAGEIAATPSLVRPGETVTLRWYFTGDKVVVSGGRFGKGVVVTGKTSLTDTPKVTTRYVFTTNYHGQDGKGVVRPLTAKFNIVVEVLTPLVTAPVPYHGPHGWDIAAVTGWRTDVFYKPAQGRDITYFQPEQDSLERITVAVVPEKMADCETLLKKITDDMPTYYTKFKVVSQQQITQCGEPAILAVFTGKDVSHQEADTESMVLAFVHGNHCYVVSARTRASYFRLRQPQMEKMLRSFKIKAG